MRVKLEKLNKKQLLELCADYGLNIPSSYFKDEIVQEILDSLEDERDDILQSNNLVINTIEKKFDIYGSKGLDFVSKLSFDSFKGDGEFPMFRVVLRDPEWAFIVWQFYRRDQKIVDDEKNELLLRVHINSVNDEFNVEGDDDFFDVELDKSDNSRYVNLPVQDRIYSMEILVRHNQNERVLLRSNSVYSRNVIFNEKSRNDLDMLMIETGLYDSFDSEKSSEDEIPQRIISMSNSDYFDGDLKGDRE